MIRVLCLGAMIAAGAAWPLVLAAAVTIYSPWVAAAVLGTLVVRQRLQADRASTSVRFCRAVADDLRGGTSLREGVAAAAEDMGEYRLARACRMGSPYSDLAAEMRHALPGIGVQAATAIQVAGLSGGRAAETFEALALIAVDDQELEGEIRAATAQVRASAGVIASLPVLLLVGLVAAGQLSIITSADSTAAVLLVVGGCLIGLGWLVIWRMIRGVRVH